MKNFYELDPEQQRNLYKVQDKLNECRQLLDRTMYGFLDTPGETINELREAYNHICRALEKVGL